MVDLNKADRARHDLIWIESGSWAAVLAARSDIAQHPLAAEWVYCGRPLIVRRTAQADDANCVPFGLPLPPAHGKSRICGVLPTSSISASAPPPRLADALGCIPRSWRKTVDRLLDLSPDVQTYGSLAWEHLTGLPYLSAASDLDLLWRHDDRETTERRLDEISKIDRDAPMRIDGEMVDASGSGVQWRELASKASAVIAKRIDGASLVSRAVFLEGEDPC
jgi:malonate decarboxylase holo-[acyl-carrier-protein] synthase